MVEGGWVTLSGSVEWDYQRKAATAAVRLSGTVRNWSERELAQHAAWGTHGVSMVIDNITLAI